MSKDVNTEVKLIFEDFFNEAAKKKKFVCHYNPAPTSSRGKFKEGELIQVHSHQNPTYNGQIGTVVGYIKYPAANAYFTLLKDKYGNDKVVGVQSHFAKTTGKFAQPGGEWEKYLPRNCEEPEEEHVVKNLDTDFEKQALDRLKELGLLGEIKHDYGRSDDDFEVYGTDAFYWYANIEKQVDFIGPVLQKSSRYHTRKNRRYTTYEYTSCPYMNRHYGKSDQYQANKPKDILQVFNNPLFTDFPKYKQTYEQFQNTEQVIHNIQNLSPEINEKLAEVFRLLNQLNIKPLAKPWYREYIGLNLIDGRTYTEWIERNYQIGYGDPETLFVIEDSGSFRLSIYTQSEYSSESASAHNVQGAGVEGLEKIIDFLKTNPSIQRYKKLTKRIGTDRMDITSI
jgi:hypothetical protein